MLVVAITPITNALHMMSGTFNKWTIVVVSTRRSYDSKQKYMNGVSGKWVKDCVKLKRKILRV
jgi:hypothetical protein